MKKVTIDELDNWMGPAAVKRPVGDAVGAERLGLRYYELEPGESTAFGYHAHAEQEEVFYVLEGVLTLETENGDVAVEAGEAARFAPREFQQSHNETDSRAKTLAVGAPADAGELILLRACEACGERTDQRIEPADGGEALVTQCVECGAETGRFT